MFLGRETGGRRKSDCPALREKADTGRDGVMLVGTGVNWGMEGAGGKLGRTKLV